MGSCGGDAAALGPRCHRDRHPCRPHHRQCGPACGSWDRRVPPPHATCSPSSGRVLPLHTDQGGYRRNLQHHWLIYGCEEPGAESPTWNCGEMAVKEPGMGSAQPCSKGSQIIYAWAMDAKSLELPKGVGFR